MNCRGGVGNGVRPTQLCLGIRPTLLAGPTPHSPNSREDLGCVCDTLKVQVGWACLQGMVEGHIYLLSMPDLSSTAKGTVPWTPSEVSSTPKTLTGFPLSL